MSRLLIAGTGSGCGKTTLSLALMRAYKNRGLSVCPLKTGPDYIDPAFHQRAAGREGDNLDLHLMGEGGVVSVLERDERESALALIEGVMGYYDGVDAHSFSLSTYETARVTKTPAVLAADAAGGAASVAAAVLGFMTLVKNSGIRGVIITRAAGDRHYALCREAIERHTGLPCYGYLARDKRLSLPSRHLGLVPAEETEELDKTLDLLGRMAEDTIDLDGLLRLSADAPPLPPSPPLPIPKKAMRLGVARDRAFHFYYRENLRLLKESGAELVYFSPLRDDELPDNLDGLYLGGGFPEVFKEELSKNEIMRLSVRAALEGGLPCYAECGGMMYLCRAVDGAPMVGFLDADARMTDRLQRFGYVHCEDASGRHYPGHSFHYSLTEEFSPMKKAFSVCRSSGSGAPWRDGYLKKNTLAGYTHLHFLSNPDLIRRLWP